MRTCGAEKLPWLVIEVEVEMLSEPGASRSGNSSLVSSAKRRYLKLSASKDPCERTPIANERARVSSLHA